MNLLPSPGTADRWFLKRVYLNLVYDLENTTYIEDTILTSAYKTAPEKKGKPKQRIYRSGQMCGWLDRWIYGWIDVWVHGWMNGGMDE